MLPFVLIYSPGFILLKPTVRTAPAPRLPGEHRRRGSQGTFSAQENTFGNFELAGICSIQQAPQLVESNSYYIFKIFAFFSNMWFASIFSHFIGSLLIMLIVSLLCRSIFVWCVPTCWLALVACVFDVISRKSSGTLMARGFSQCFFLGVSWQLVSCLSLYFILGYFLLVVLTGL